MSIKNETVRKNIEALKKQGKKRPKALNQEQKALLGEAAKSAAVAIVKKAVGV